MGKLALYGLDASPPTRACLLTLKALELPFEYVFVNLLTKENFAEDYLKKNPQHTVPMLQDDDAYLWDSHAIMAYLVGKYAETDDLYPKDLLQRAVVDQRMHFESGVIFEAALRRLTRPVLFLGGTTLPQANVDYINEVYDFLETFLEHDFVAGDHLTIADFSIVSTISSLGVYLELDPVKYPKIAAWLERLKELPYYEEANGSGAAQFMQLMKSKNFTVVP
ncbi:glutathione S-transferase 1 [Drosophila guanche]|uniref:Blast:Glutathione S-transferase 1 n=1 Tax=Drosophila guanche TaxID=7266 RepID=A0A3B0J2X5_DROGU|nr:glutathione S-transferase 1 [Drosophila guanche]SPP75874.1 blast:Glutathione S-transferase 1 [Drosophila guanche]